MALPANVSFGTVTGRFLTATADSPTDTDRDPEGNPATDLRIVFAPNVTPAVVRDASASPPTIFALAEIPATVGASGDLIGADGQPGIRLVATTGTTIDPSGWTWKVTLSSPTFPALSFSFSLDPGQTVDLASVVQVPASPGATLAAWLQAVADANAAADRAEAAAGTGSTSGTAQQSWGATVVAIGDSITAGDGDPGNGLPGNSWATYAALASDGRMHLARNAGIGGNTSTQMLARFDTDVLAYNPSVVLIGTGTNDTTPATDTLPAVESMIRKAKAAGCAVALVTPPPAGDPTHPLATTPRTKLLQAHRVLLGLGRKYGIRVVDQRSLLLDPTTGTYRAGASVDGTHPTPYTSRALGQNVWTVIADQFPPTPTYLADDPYDLTTLGGSSADGSHGGALVNRALLPTGSPIPGTLTPSWPQGWDNYGDAATVTMSNNDPAIPGNVFTCQPTGTGAHYTGYAITTGYSVGDRIRVAFKFKVTGIDVNGGELSIGLKTPDGTASNISTLTLRADVPNWATWVGEGIVSPGTTQLYFQFNTTGAGVTASVAQVTIDNLTTLGLA